VLASQAQVEQAVTRSAHGSRFSFRVDAVVSAAAVRTLARDDHQKHAQPRGWLLLWPGRAEGWAMPATATS